MCLLLVAIGQTVELFELESCQLGASVSQWAKKQTWATLSAAWISLPVVVATITALSAADREGDFSIVGTENRARAHWALDATTLVGCCLNLAHIVRQVKRLNTDGPRAYSILIALALLAWSGLIIRVCYNLGDALVDATALTIDQAERVSGEISRVIPWRMFCILAKRLVAMLLNNAGPIKLPPPTAGDPAQVSNDQDVSIPLAQLEQTDQSRKPAAEEL